MSVPEPSAAISPAQAHFRHRVRVYWEDTAAGGIVFYGNYLKFMERARTEWLRALGFDQEGMRRSGEGMFIVADTQMRFIKPAQLDDALTVTVSVVEQGRASLTFSQDVWRGETLLTQGWVRIGWVQRHAAHDGGESVLKPGRIPARILAVLSSPLVAPASLSGGSE
jgi:acyl-CoA thioester hydrolase